MPAQTKRRYTLLAELPFRMALIGEPDGTTRAVCIVDDQHPGGENAVRESDYALLPKATVVECMPQRHTTEDYACHLLNDGRQDFHAMCVALTGDWFVYQPPVAVPMGAFGGGR